MLGTVIKHGMCFLGSLLKIFELATTSYRQFTYHYAVYMLLLLKRPLFRSCVKILPTSYAS